MSRNATARRPRHPEMPTWWQLVKAMIDRLYPLDGDNDSRRKTLLEQAGATSVALRLADEFAAAFGRSALDELILDYTPDQDFDPSSLHRLLVDLPWADILTTNYDTLLERAADEGYGRRYSVVRTAAELPVLVRPRIVKLHGSFPSTRPFVFGEEDFRTYPQRFAAFVNLARQTVLENVLCLIGFSGDDPNFLAWTGWVRDQLADHSPRVYLCGLLNLTNAQRSVLQARGVVPIDLTPLFPIDASLDQSERHRLAIEWFLTSLRHGRPYDPMEWPTPPPASTFSALSKKGTLNNSEAVPQNEPYSPSEDSSPSSKTPLEQLFGVADVWKKNRELYPGWLIAPENVRSRLVHTTNHNWESVYLRSRNTMKPHEDLNWLYELNWRLETALMPIWNHLVTAYEQVLTAINPFPKSLTDLGSSPVTPDTPGGDALDWITIRRQWLAVALGLLRHYREERKWAEFDRREKRIAAITDAPSDCLARWCYERCLQGFCNLDDAAVQAGLNDWPKETNDPFWAIRRAGVLAELGHSHDAAELVDTTLRKIRRGLEDSNRHIPALSREGWALWLAHGLRNSIAWRNGRLEAWEQDRRDIRQRFRQLRPFGADPDDLTDKLELKLSGPAPVRRPMREQRRRFQPGLVSTTLHSGDGLIEKLLPAYQFMRLCEESGIPPRVGSSTFSETHLKYVAEWFQELDPVRTQSLMFRLLDEKVIEGYLSRHRLASLPAEIVSNWQTTCMKAAHDALPNAGHKLRNENDLQSRSRRRLKTATELLARTSVRANADEFTPLWDLTITLCQAEQCRRVLSGDGLFRPLLDNLLQSTFNDLLQTRFRDLFDLPLPGEPGFEVSRGDFWPDPAADLGFKLTDADWQPETSGWKSVVEKLIHSLDHEKFVVRTAALTRLFVLDKFKLLRQADRVRVGKAFWSSVLKSDSLPFDRWKGYTLTHALHWPQPKSVNAAEQIKNYLLQQKIGNSGWFGNHHDWFDEVISFTNPAGASPVIHRLSWTIQERLKLFGIIRKWWDMEGSKQAVELASGKETWTSDRHEFGRFLIHMWDVVRQVILIRDKSNMKVEQLVLQLVKDVEKAEQPVGCVVPALLRNSVESYDNAATTIRRELSSSRHDFRLSALRGLVYWADADRSQPSKKPLPTPPTDLIRELGAAVAMRHSVELRLMLAGAYAILRRYKTSADDKFLDGLLIGLDYLFTEAQYRNPDEPSHTICYDDVPSVRVECVRIARLSSEIGRSTDSRVIRWLEAAAQDPLPEVRAAANGQSNEDV
jgi:SIR2-like domain